MQYLTSSASHSTPPPRQCTPAPLSMTPLLQRPPEDMARGLAPEDMGPLDPLPCFLASPLLLASQYTVHKSVCNYPPVAPWLCSLGSETCMYQMWRLALSNSFTYTSPLAQLSSQLGSPCFIAFSLAFILLCPTLLVGDTEDRGGHKHYKQVCSSMRTHIYNSLCP